MTEIQLSIEEIQLREQLRQYASIYDRLNNQPHLQELIATPLLEQLDRDDEDEDLMLYHMYQKEWHDLLTQQLGYIISTIGWDTDAHPGSFTWYMIHGQKL